MAKFILQKGLKAVGFIQTWMDGGSQGINLFRSHLPLFLLIVSTALPLSCVGTYSGAKNFIFDT